MKAKIYVYVIWYAECFSTIEYPCHSSIFPTEQCEFYEITEFLLEAEVINVTKPEYDVWSRLQNSNEFHTIINHVGFEVCTTAEQTL